MFLQILNYPVEVLYYFRSVWCNLGQKETKIAKQEENYAYKEIIILREKHNIRFIFMLILFNLNHIQHLHQMNALFIKFKIYICLALLPYF